jgi:uncharacterized protein
MNFGLGALLLGLAAMTLLAGACQAQPRVTIHTRGGKDVSFTVEVADTPSKREMGFQYRRELAADRGMIFVFGREEEHTFWMKNTPIPLDMIFIGRDRRIVGIAEQATPFSLAPRTVSVPGQFVLEINGGLCKRYGISTGDTVRFEGISVESATE